MSDKLRLSSYGYEYLYSGLVFSQRTIEEVLRDDGGLDPNLFDLNFLRQVLEEKELRQCSICGTWSQTPEMDGETCWDCSRKVSRE